MSISIKRIAAGLLASTVVLGAAVVGANPADALNPVTDTRFAGANRYDTARQTALAAYPLGANNVVLARGDLFPDALAGSYLAGSLNAPVLLTESGSLHPEALAGLVALGANTVHLLGSEAALSANVRNQVTAAGFATTRIGGDNRYDTAAKVATTPGAAVVGVLGGFGRTAIVASGENFPDALAAGPIAHRADFPLLLTRPDSLPTETAGALSTLGIQHVLMIGGTTAVNDSVKTAIEATGVSVDRRFGPDRFATAANLAGFARTTLGWTVDELILATGFGFADAVSAGALGGVRSAPIVLTDDVLPAPSVQVCTDNQPTLTKLFVEGGPTVVTPGAVNACRIAGQGPVIVLPEPTLAGYVWANQAASPAYTPSTAYQYNSTGGTNTVVRNAAGDYTVRFPGLGVAAGTVSVTSYATADRCKVEGWDPAAGGALDVDVRCFTPAGVADDA
ncbi:MAG: cell wall-binding repeat-containing protein, partial [Acidimicrobiales bacterium]